MCWGQCRRRFSARRLRPSTPTMAISKPIFVTASVWATPNAPALRRAICRAEPAGLYLQACTCKPVLTSLGFGRSGRRFHFQFGIEIGDDLLEGQNRGLDRRDLHQFPATNRTAAILQRHDQIAPLLLKLNKR